MLREIKNVKQEGGAGRRRWFESEDLEVVVWFEPDDRVIGFQLCYNFGRGDHALTWRAGSGFAHDTIDMGDESPLANRTPILVPDGRVPWAELSRLFDERSGTLEPGLRQMIQSAMARRDAAGDAQ